MFEVVEVFPYGSNTVADDQGPLLLTWINFNLSMDK